MYRRPWPLVEAGERGARSGRWTLQTSEENETSGRGKMRSRENHTNREAPLGAAGGVGDEIGPKRQRGRPAGSKNKPKPSVMMMSNEKPHAFRPHVLEISNGFDVVESVANFARGEQEAICVLSGRGTVSNVTLCKPTAPGTFVSLQGNFEILSLSGGFIVPAAPSGASGLMIQLASGQGQLVGGCVVGALAASGPVIVIVASFMNATYERLPENEEPTPVPLEAESSPLTGPPQQSDSLGDAANTSWPSARPPPY